MFTPNFYGYSENEIKQYLMARAIEWNTWPGFLSQPIFPILLIFYKWWAVISFFILASLLWSLVKYRFVNVKMAEFGIFFAKLKWLSIPACAIYFISGGKYGIAILAVLWPMVAASLGAGGRIGAIEHTFARKLGFLPYADNLLSEEEPFEASVDRVTKQMALTDASGKTVLLLFYSDNVHRLLDDELHDFFGSKINVMHFYSSVAAFNYLISSNVDLVISEILLEDKTGIQLLNACKTLYPQLPFIINCGYDYRSDFFTKYAPDEYIIMSPDLSKLLNAADNQLSSGAGTEETNYKIKSNDTETLLKLETAYREMAMR